MVDASREYVLHLAEYAKVRKGSQSQRVSPPIGPVLLTDWLPVRLTHLEESS